MSYTLEKAKDSSAIAEREFSVGDTLTFTNFNSCIGVVGADGNKLTGIHLSMLNKDNEKFNDTAALKVANRLAAAEKVKVFGLIDIWLSDDAQIATAYKQMITYLGQDGRTVIEEQKGNGVYSASLVNGNIVIT